MKFPVSLLLPLVLVSVRLSAAGISLPVAAPVSDDTLLAAIAEVETGNNSSRLGHSGERTQLQILPQTWREYSRLPHSVAAANPAETDRVARAYLAHIRARLKARGLPDTPFFVAAGWNAGPGWKRLSSRTISYAERVANLVEEAQPREGLARLTPVNPLTPLPAITLADSLTRGLKVAQMSVPRIDVGSN